MEEEGSWPSRMEGFIKDRSPAGAEVPQKDSKFKIKFRTIYILFKYSPYFLRHSDLQKLF